jgi:hypothetical protein
MSSDLRKYSINAMKAIPAKDTHELILLHRLIPMLRPVIANNKQY